MSIVKVNDNILEMLDESDRDLLLGIYTHRCINEELAARYYYGKTKITDRIVRLMLQALCTWGLIRPVCYSQEARPAYFLTQRGVAVVQHLFSDHLREIYKPDKQDKPLPTAHDLQMRTQIIDHQLYLNRFALEFDSYARGILRYQYYDGKFMPEASRVLMPDGVIDTPAAVLLIETDTGKENMPRMIAKWERYRSFLNYPGTFYQDRTIYMLFILENLKNSEKRMRNVANNLLQYVMEYATGTFDVFIADRARCHTIIQTRILHQETPLTREFGNVLRDICELHGMTISSARFTEATGYSFDAYIRKRDETGNIVSEGERLQEFLVDIWMDSRISVIRNASYIEQFEQQCAARFERRLPYLIVCPGEKQVLTLFRLIGRRSLPMLYYTTPQRLKSLPWNKAVFVLDQLGNVAHFEDASLSVPVYEKRLRR